MTKYKKKPMRVRGSTANGVSPGKRKIKIQLAKENGLESLVMILINVFYLLNSPSNFVILNFLNDIRIYNHNEDQILYDQSFMKILIFAKRYKTSFLLYSLNLSTAAVKLFRKYQV